MVALKAKEADAKEKMITEQNLMIKKRKVKHSTPTKKNEVTDVRSVKPSQTSISFREVDSAALPHPFLPARNISRILGRHRDISFHHAPHSVVAEKRVVAVRETAVE